MFLGWVTGILYQLLILAKCYKLLLQIFIVIVCTCYNNKVIQLLSIQLFHLFITNVYTCALKLTIFPLLIIMCFLLIYMSVILITIIYKYIA